MKILFVTEQFPYPLDSGGNIRTFHVLRQLAKEHTVILAACERAEHTLAHYKQLEPYCSRIKMFPPVPRGALRQGYYLLESLFGKRPYPVNKNYSTGMFQWIRKSVSDVDVVHFNHLDAACYADNLEGVFVFDTHNLISNIYQKMLDRERNPLKKFYLSIQHKKTIDYEARIIRRMALCLACSEEDKKAIGDLAPAVRAETIPNGVDTVSYVLDTGRSFSPADRNLVFVGAMDYLPNSDGIRFFCEEVFGILQKRLPDIRLTVVGRNPPESIKRFESESLTVTGFVEDIGDWVRRADLMVVPIRIGGGTRIKILEGMAQGIPVISTKTGAEGIEAVHRRDIFLADTPQETVEGIVELLQCPGLRQDLARGGRDLVERKYGWDVVGRKLSAVYSTIN